MTAWRLAPFPAQGLSMPIVQERQLDGIGAESMESRFTAISKVNCLLVLVLHASHKLRNLLRDLHAQLRVM